MLSGKRVLVLAPHTDDETLGCGGTINAYAASAIELRVLAFSAAEKSSEEAGHSPDVTVKEFSKAMLRLGVDDSFIIRGFPVREFPKHRQGILDAMIAERKGFDPDVVLAPSAHDTHQDHQVIHQEALRAFRDCSILGYEIPRNMTSIDNSGVVYVGLSKTNLRAKTAAFNCYESQRHRRATNEVSIQAWAMACGAMIACNKRPGHLAERHEVIRWIT